MINYLLIALAVLIFFIYYLGLYHTNKSDAVLTIRKRLSAYDGGKYAPFVAGIPADNLYEQTVITVLLASILWPIELVALIWLQIQKLFR